MFRYVFCFCTITAVVFLFNDASLFLERHQDFHRQSVQEHRYDALDGVDGYDTRDILSDVKTSGDQSLNVTDRFAQSRITRDPIDLQHQSVQEPSHDALEDSDMTRADT